MTRYQKNRARLSRMVRRETVKADGGRVAKNTIVLYFRMLVAMAVGFLTSRFQLAILGIENLGLYGVAASVVGMVVFLNGSLSGSGSRFLTVEFGKGTPGSLRRVFATLVHVQIGLGLIFVVLLETVGLYFLVNKLNIDPARMSAVKWCYHCAVVVTFLSITQVPYGAAIVAHERMSAFAWMTIFDIVSRLLILFLLYVSPWDRLKTYATLGVCVSVFSILIYRIYCMRNFTEARYRFIFDKKLLKPMFSFAGWHLATQFVIMLLQQGVVMVNQAYLGPAVVASIGLAQHASSQVEAFIGNFKAAANPQIIKLHSSRQFDAAKLMLTGTIHFSVYLLLVFGVPLWFYSNELMTVWLGDNVPAVTPVMVKVMLIGSFFAVFDVSLYVILYAEGRIKENMWFNLIEGVIVFAAICLLVRYTRNPMSSVVVLALFKVVLGMCNKPILLHYIAGYRFRDFVNIFAPCFKAALLCALFGSLFRLALPGGLVWSVFSSVVLVVVNGLAIFCLVATENNRQQAIRLSSRIPGFGTRISCMLARVGSIGKVKN